MATKKATAPKAAPVQTRFPKRELNAWLKQNLTWNHQQWLDLIEDLNKQGFVNFTNTQAGLDEIGLYLETKKNNI